jgi:hypothetical protein
VKRIDIVQLELTMEVMLKVRLAIGEAVGAILRDRERQGYLQQARIPEVVGLGSVGQEISNTLE